MSSGKRVLVTYEVEVCRASKIWRITDFGIDEERARQLYEQRISKNSQMKNEHHERLVKRTMVIQDKVLDTNG